MSVPVPREAAPFRLLDPHLAMGRGCPREEWTDWQGDPQTDRDGMGKAP
jgi:hypothetical protein